jgi:hypothetical protein
MSASVGADVESICNKCGDVWHVIVAKVGAQIVKVQCKECGAYHRHRHPTAVAASKARSSAPRSRRSAAGSGPVREEPSTFTPDPSAARPYNMRDTFQAGEQISHPRFGIGLVERSSEPGKMSVLFADGRRVLAQAKQSSSLDTANQMKPRGEPGEPI